MQNSKDIDEEMRQERIAACYAIEKFILGLDAGGGLNVYWLAVAAFHAGKAKSLFEVGDQVVDHLEEKLKKREPKA